MLQFVSNTLHGFVLGYELLNLLTSTVILFLIFVISKSLLEKIAHDDESYAFLVAMIFCLLFNKDELYAWSVIFVNNLAFIIYLGSMYFFVNSEKHKHGLFLSVLLYAIAIFTYELGIILPAFYLVVLVIEKKPVKKILYYAIPLGFYGLIRLTNWFGFGYIFIGRNDLTGVWEIFPIFLKTIISSGVMVKKNISFSYVGLMDLTDGILCFLIVINLLATVLMYQVFSKHFSFISVQKNLKESMNFLFITISGLLICYIPMVLRNYIATRHMIFIDLFISLILAFFIKLIPNRRLFLSAFCFIVFLCLFINQGLYVNWVTSGSIQAGVNQSIFENSGSLSHYRYVYFNATDLSENKENSINYQPENAALLYSPFFNSPGLDLWVVTSVFNGAKIELSNRTLIYGTYGNVYVSSDNQSLTFRDTSSGRYHTINRNEYFEFNATNLLSNEKRPLSFS